jgi:hypothetical protein
MLLLTDSVLARAVSWTHQIGPEGAETEVAFTDGSRVSSTAVKGVLNRLTGPPLQHILPLVTAADRLYASQELTAFYLSWLQSLPGVVVNRPTPQGLCGRWRHASEWVCLAAQAGLTTASYWQTALGAPPDAAAGRLLPSGASASTVVVVGQRALGTAVPSEIREACVGLAALAGEAVLGIELVPSLTGPWTFVGASPMPDLRLGGEDLLDALAELMRSGQNQHAARTSE